MANVTELPVPRSEWVEFASRGWCAEANRYLQEQAALHPEALDGVEWSITERWRNAPPHLGWRDNIAGFWFRIADGKIEVGAGPVPEADTKVDGDYNAILPIGWTIYGGDAEVQARAQREYGHLSRDKPVQMRGKFPSHPPLLPFLGGLHDHMARRTINNPDVEHRIEQYGLRSKVAELGQHGCTTLEDAFTDQMADELREQGAHGRLWEEMVVHPWVLTLVDHAFGNRAVLANLDTDSTGPGSLMAVWSLVEEDAQGVKQGNIILNRDTPTLALPDRFLQLAYRDVESVPAKPPFEISEAVMRRNPPVFSSLCGLDAAAGA